MYRSIFHLTSEDLHKTDVSSYIHGYISALTVACMEPADGSASDQADKTSADARHLANDFVHYKCNIDENVINEIKQGVDALLVAAFYETNRIIAEHSICADAINRVFNAFCVEYAVPVHNYASYIGQSLGYYQESNPFADNRSLEYRTDEEIKVMMEEASDDLVLAHAAFMKKVDEIILGY